MKTLWAPWRMEFILSAHQASKKSRQKKVCVFCAAQIGKMTTQNLVLYRGKLAYVLMNKYPYSNGHLLIIPNRHLADYDKLNAAEHAEMGKLLAQSMTALKKALRPEGFNLGMNLGKVAGAGIREHLHYHIVPRWTGDSNFMPILAEARCLPEHLLTTYAKVKKEFDRLL
jgi:ATP adenylyltransferase